MNTLDKYEFIISKIQEMCTSTVAMAPYPMNGVSVTTVSYKPGKKTKSQKQEKMPTKAKAIVEELLKQCKGNQRNKIMYNYKYRKNRLSETISTIANTCFDIIEEVTEKDIKGARRRKLKRLETIGASLDKKRHQAEAEFEKAENKEKEAYNILVPRINQISNHIQKGESPSREAAERAHNKFVNWKQSQADKEEARKKSDSSYDKYRENLRTQLQVRGITV